MSVCSRLSSSKVGEFAVIPRECHIDVFKFVGSCLRCICSQCEKSGSSTQFRQLHNVKAMAKRRSIQGALHCACSGARNGGSRREGASLVLQQVPSSSPPQSRADPLMLTVRATSSSQFVLSIPQGGQNGRQQACIAQLDGSTRSLLQFAPTGRPTARLQ